MANVEKKKKKNNIRRRRTQISPVKAVQPRLCRPDGFTAAHTSTRVMQASLCSETRANVTMKRKYRKCSFQEPEQKPSRPEREVRVQLHLDGCTTSAMNTLCCGFSGYLQFGQVFLSVHIHNLQRRVSGLGLTNRGVNGV